MNLVALVKDAYFKRMASKFSSLYDFEEALTYIKKISSYEKQREILYMQLLAYAISDITKSGGVVEVTDDKKRSSQIEAMVSKSRLSKGVLLLNHETDELDSKSVQRLFERVVPESNPLRIYLTQIRLAE